MRERERERLTLVGYFGFQCDDGRFEFLHLFNSHCDKFGGCERERKKERERER